MESVVLIVISAFVLYYLSLKQDHMADNMFGEAFNRFERRYNNVTYSCPNSTVVKKKVFSLISAPIIPSINYSVRALCLTEKGDWFWFDANIRFMKLKHTSITPATREEASKALKNDPECLQRYFPDNNHANHA